MGLADGNTGFYAVHPAVVYGPADRFLAVWSGNDENEIYGQLLKAGESVARLEGVLIEIPGEFLASSPYPNPFNSETMFTLALKRAQHVEIAVFDMLGRRVMVLHQGLVEAGQVRSFTFEAGVNPSGPYFIRAIGESFRKSLQVMLVR